MPRYLTWCFLLCSFVVYLLPLPTVHAGAVPLGRLLLSGWPRAGEAMMWLTTWAVALTLQTLLVLVLYGVSRAARRWKILWLSMLPVAIALYALTLWLYLAAIPKVFLIGFYTASAPSTWPLACTVPDAALSGTRDAIDPLAEAGQALARFSKLPADRWVLVSMPDCQVSEVALPTGQGRAFPLVVRPGPVILYKASSLARWRQDSAPQQELWWYKWQDRAVQPLQDPRPSSQYKGEPVLSAAGHWIAWTQPSAARPLNPWVYVTSPTQALASTISIDADLALCELLWFDPGQQEVWLFDALHRQVQKRGFDGHLKGVALTWDDTMVKPVRWTIRLLDNGWVAWDGYRDTGPYRVAWDLASRKGHHRVSTGNKIEDLAVHPEGHFIAISLGIRYSVGGSRGVVYVFRVQDQKEVFRTYLSAHSQSRVVFLGREHFAYTHYDDDSQKVEIRVFKIMP